MRRLMLIIPERANENYLLIWEKVTGMDRVFKVKEAAQYLCVHEETIRRLARRGEIPSFKVGRGWRFKENDLTDWAKKQYQIVSPQE